ncbi:hypothetical protein GGI25_006349 [Coemansia spiralis]|uniref:Uncharacterized protein n=2 Tax=Coemansia TaxID=4863 RepID=A0A9W8FX21_9FUNG|nr:hypothetical protein EDC05_006260 [Coemansia umbellata]KAJ2622665.1 hypothetical protein GGI26_003111 [Coemansia sp. RSA 1358]KAJ2668794.1 hypothetical protein GGI25_006349 [Coemansia spiralis]
MLATKVRHDAAKQIARPARKLIEANRPALVCAPEEYPGSPNYVPGQQGYAPGFPPPRKWRATVQKKPEPLRAHELPSSSTPKPATALESNPERVYRQKVRMLRHTYHHDHLLSTERREAELSERMQRAREFTLDRRARLARERNQYVINVLEDPVSSENVLNAEGRTLMPNIPDKHGLNRLEPGHKLEPPRVSVAMPPKANRERAEERARNRSVMRELQYEGRVQTLMALYHEAESFVHYGNLGKKIHECVNILSVSQPTLGEMVNDLKSNGGVVTAAEAGRRTAELRNLLLGTSGRQGRLGIDGLKKWTEEHGNNKE